MSLVESAAPASATISSSSKRPGPTRPCLDPSCDGTIDNMFHALCLDCRRRQHAKLATSGPSSSRIKATSAMKVVEQVRESSRATGRLEYSAAERIQDGASASRASSSSPALRQSTLGIGFKSTNGTSRPSYVSSTLERPPNKKPRLDDGSPRVSTGIDRYVSSLVPHPSVRASSLLWDDAESSPSGTSRNPAPFPLNDDDMAPIHPQVLKDDPMEDMTSYQAIEKRQSKSELKQDKPKKSRKKAPIISRQPSLSDTHDPIVSSSSSALAGLSLSSADLNDGSGDLGSTKMCSVNSCKALMPIETTFKTCERCRAISRDGWHRTVQRKKEKAAAAAALAISRDSSAGAENLASPSPVPDAKPPVPTADTSQPRRKVQDESELPPDTKLCTTCKIPMSAAITFKLCELCRAKGREANRRASEKKRQRQTQITEHRSSSPVDLDVDAEEEAEPSPIASTENEYQSASAMIEALKKARQSRKLMRFQGTISTVTTPRVTLERRLKLTHRELRKLVRIPFGTQISAVSDDTTASASYRCRCSAPKVPPEATAELDADVAEACRGMIQLQITPDRTHPRLPGERTIIKVVH